MASWRALGADDWHWPTTQALATSEALASRLADASLDYKMATSTKVLIKHTGLIELLKNFDEFAIRHTVTGEIRWLAPGVDWKLDFHNGWGFVHAADSESVWVQDILTKKLMKFEGVGNEIMIDDADSMPSTLYDMRVAYASKWPEIAHVKSEDLHIRAAVRKGLASTWSSALSRRMCSSSSRRRC